MYLQHNNDHSGGGDGKHCQYSPDTADAVTVRIPMARRTAGVVETPEVVKATGAVVANEERGAANHTPLRGLRCLAACSNKVNKR